MSKDIMLGKEGIEFLNNYGKSGWELVSLLPFTNSSAYVNVFFKRVKKINNFTVGSKIYFSSEKRPYTVKAFDGRYAICTKPFNLKNTVIYTIVDLLKNVRGPNNLVFNLYDYKKDKDIERCLTHLQREQLIISDRNKIELDIEKVI